MGLENSVEFATEAEGYSEHKEYIVNGGSYPGVFIPLPKL